MQFAKVNGVTLHYAATGDFRARPALAFINSLGADFRIWHDVAVLAELIRAFATAPPASSRAPQ